MCVCDMMISIIMKNTCSLTYIYIYIYIYLQKFLFTKLHTHNLDSRECCIYIYGKPQYHANG